MGRLFSNVVGHICLFLLFLCPYAVLGQDITKGVYWAPPQNMEQATTDLYQMSTIGIEAVRMPYTPDESLYTLADSLGLALYQELPFRFLPAGDLVDAIAPAQKILREALSLASRFESTRHFGLAAYSDTSTPSSCAYFEALTEYATTVTNLPVTFYYTTLFVETEECGSFVDMIFVDALDDSDHLAKRHAWYEKHPGTPLAYGAVGTWVKQQPDGTQNGYRQVNSPDFQARYLETSLSTLLEDGIEHPIRALFIYRWRDSYSLTPSPAQDLQAPYAHNYGLLSEGNTPRTAYKVVQGFYTGEQNVFAFLPGEPSPRGNYWIILLIWINLFILSATYAYFPRFRLNIRRYFTARGFFREAISEGRELLVGPNALLFFIFSVAFGLCVVVSLDHLRTTDAFSLLLQWVPPSFQSTVVAFLAQPYLLFIVISGCYGLFLSVWTSGIAALSTRARRSLLPGQSFMLVVWSQWPIVGAMILAGVLNAHPQAQSFIVPLLITISVIIAVGTLATLSDYAAICRIRFIQILIAILINPFFIMLLACTYSCITNADKFFFIIHLLATI